MKSEVRIAVVTPSFNQGRFIESTLRSIITQDYPAIEYVVMDGGSTDGSVATIERYAGSLAYWASEPDRGYAHAINKGFARTSGEIMCWLNSSDMHYPWTLATVSQIFSALPEVEWLMGLPTQFSSSGGPRTVGRGFFNVYDFLAGNCHWIQQESVFWRRGLWERAGGGLDDGLKRAADFDLWLRFLRLAPLYHAGTILGGWRVHENALGDASSGVYSREAEELLAAFAAGYDRRALRRARYVKAVGYRQGQLHTVGQGLRKLGVWPWYTHPRVVYDFETEQWVAR